MNLYGVTVDRVAYLGYHFFEVNDSWMNALPSEQLLLPRF